MQCPDCGTSVALSKGISKQSGEEHECPKCGNTFEPDDHTRRLLKA